MAEEPTRSNEQMQKRYREFVELAPLAAALAGLPVSGTRLHSEEQIEGRATTMRAAYRGAHALIAEIAGDDPQRYRQFLDLMTTTIALAGLPVSEGRLFTDDHIEARLITVRAAYRVARATAKEHLGGS